MEVLDYTPNKLAEIAGMAKSHGISLDPSLLPRVGKFVPGLAAGFLYQTDSKVAFIDNVISNASAPLIKRTRAVSAVITALVAEAKGLGFSVTLSTSKLPGLCSLTKRLGFKVHDENYKLITRVL